MKTLDDFLDENMFNDIFEQFSHDDEDLDITLIEAQEVAARQPWGDFEHKDAHKGFAKDALKHFYKKEMEPHIDKAEKPFHRVIHAVKPHNAKALAARKTLDSLHSKVIERGKAASGVTDALRGAIIVKNDKDAEKVVNNLKKKAHVVKHEYKSKGKQGDAGYYGAHHLILNVNGVHSEVQVHTRKGWNSKKQADKIYQKYRDMKKPEDHPDYQKDMKTSRDVFARANRFKKE